MGIYSEDQLNWMSVDGEVMNSNLILWGSNQPDGLIEDSFLGISAADGSPG